MESTPNELKPYQDAYKLRIKREDEMMWQMGIYITDAVSYAVEHCLAGQKARSEYRKEPMLKDMLKSQEEIDAEALKEMLRNEEMWQLQAHRKGLPTVNE